MIIGIFRATPSAFAKEVPTRSEPRSPGPLVKAIAVRSVGFIPALAKAWLTTGTMFCS